MTDFAFSAERKTDMAIASLRYDLLDLTTALRDPDKRRIIEANRDMIEMEINHFLLAFNADIHAETQRNRQIKAEQRAAQ